MRILFCKITSMKYYKGTCKNDQASFGGSFVKENGYGHEEYNFCPFNMEGTDELECMGFVEPKSNKGTRNTIHIEKLEGCELMKKETSVDDVLVVWCAKDEVGVITVVGWYKNATVWRDLQDWVCTFGDGVEEFRCYNVRAKAKDCVLLPKGSRVNYKWRIPNSSYTKSYGFGQSMIWYANEPRAKEFIETLVKNIDSYTGENHRDVYPEID